MPPGHKRSDAMSIEVMTAVWKYSKAEGTDLLVMLALVDNANEDGECWPSIRYIARKCRIDDRTVQRRIRGLETTGEVVVIRGAGKASTPGGTRSNKYRIVIHMPQEEGGGISPPPVISAGGGVAQAPGGGVAQAPPEPSLRTVKEPSLGADAKQLAEAVEFGRRRALSTEWDLDVFRDQMNGLKIPFTDAQMIAAENAFTQERSRLEVAS